MMNLKSALVIGEIKIIKELSAFLQTGLLLIRIRIVTIWIGRLAETWQEWNSNHLARSG
jgi:hypothetical protein